MSKDIKWWINQANSLQTAYQERTKEYFDLKEENQRLQKACDIFEKNSAGATRMWEALKLMEKSLGKDNKIAVQFDNAVAYNLTTTYLKRIKEALDDTGKVIK